MAGIILEIVIFWPWSAKGLPENHSWQSAFNNQRMEFVLIDLFHSSSLDIVVTSVSLTTILVGPHIHHLRRHHLAASHSVQWTIWFIIFVLFELKLITFLIYSRLEKIEGLKKKKKNNFVRSKVSSVHLVRLWTSFLLLFFFSLSLFSLL